MTSKTYPSDLSDEQWKRIKHSFHRQKWENNPAQSKCGKFSMGYYTY